MIRSSSKTIPDTDYRMQFGLLVADIAAATEQGLDEAQRADMHRNLLPRIHRIRDLNKANQRGRLDHEIRQARAIFQHIMGEHWTPNPDGQVARALKHRGITRH